MNAVAQANGAKNYAEFRKITKNKSIKGHYRTLEKTLGRKPKQVEKQEFQRRAIAAHKEGFVKRKGSAFDSLVQWTHNGASDNVQYGSPIIMDTTDDLSDLNTVLDEGYEQPGLFE